MSRRADCYMDVLRITVGKWCYTPCNTFRCLLDIKTRERLWKILTTYLEICCKYYNGHLVRRTCLLFWILVYSTFPDLSHYTVTERESSRVFTKIIQNVTKLRCKYCKVHQNANRPFTSPCYRYKNFQILWEISHTGTVVRECFKDDNASQWKRKKFDPSPHQNPLTDLHKNLQAWLRPGWHPVRKIL